MGVACSSPSDEEVRTSNVPPQRTAPLECGNGSRASDGAASKPRANGRHSIAYAPAEITSPRGSCEPASAKGPLDASLGNATRHGVSPGPSGSSYAKINQDRGVAYWPFNSSHNEALFCVFDGHGCNGEKVSEFCMKAIPAALQEHGDELRSHPEEVLTKAVCSVDKAVLKKNGGQFARSCGTTSTIVYINGSTLWAACSGDSRAVLGSSKGGKIRARDLTNDHKPDGEGELERILNAGGEVSRGEYGRPARVWAAGKIGLAMSRSVGDGECKKYGVIPNPEVQRFELAAASDAKPEGDGDRFVIVASDGVWEFIESQEACEIVASEPGSMSRGCAKLVQEAALRWKREEGNYRDDITAIVARLPFVSSGEAPTLELGLSGGSFEGDALYINMGEQGISEMGAGDSSPAPGGKPPPKSGGRGSTAASQEKDGDDFQNRRLSVAARDDDEWSDESDRDGE